MNEEDKEYFDHMALTNLAYETLVQNIYKDPQTKETIEMIQRYGVEKKTAEAILIEIVQIGGKYK